MAQTKVLTYDGLSNYTEKLKEYLSDYKDIQFCVDELERESISSPIPSKLYVVLTPLSIYIYNTAWKCLTSQDEITDEYIETLFVSDEEGELLNSITPISDETINDIWDSI